MTYASSPLAPTSASAALSSKTQCASAASKGRHFAYEITNESLRKILGFLPLRVRNTSQSGFSSY